MVTNRRFQFFHGPKHSTPDLLGRDVGEEPFDQIQPRRTGRDQVEMDPRVLGKPPLDLRMVMRGIIIHDNGQVDRLVDGSINQGQKLQKFLMPVPRHTFPHNLSTQDIQRRKQGARAMARIIVCHRSTAALLHRQAWLRTIQGL